MSTSIITLIISIITSGVTAIITYMVSIKTNLANKQEEIKREQTYKYFLPFKFIADELFWRLSHIEQRIMEKESMNVQLTQKLDNREIGWFFVDWYNVNEKTAGGYYLTSTIYLHAQLYQRMNALLREYPYLTLKIKKRLKDVIHDNPEEQIKRCLDYASQDSHIKIWTNIEELVSIQGNVTVKRLIDGIRLSTVIKGGIPYVLHTAFGDFMDLKNDKKERIDSVNYEDFCRMVMDEKQRFKFLPLFQFYSKIVDEDFNVNSAFLNKIRSLMICLSVLRHSELE